jgi:hypothetical protein
MKRLVVRTLEALSGFCIVLILLAGGVAGCTSAGFMGAIGGLIAAFFLSVFVFGALFILLEQNQSLREIRRILETDGRASMRAP